MFSALTFCKRDENVVFSRGEKKRFLTLIAGSQSPCHGWEHKNDGFWYVSFFIVQVIWLGFLMVQAKLLYVIKKCCWGKTR